jgi:hypothetical protein
MVINNCSFVAHENDFVRACVRVCVCVLWDPPRKGHTKITIIKKAFTLCVHYCLSILFFRSFSHTFGGIIALEFELVNS